LRDLMKAGRSIDSRKRGAKGTPIVLPQHDEESDRSVSAALALRVDLDVMSEVYAEDLLNVLNENLGEFDRAVLSLLTQEHSVRAIARSLGVSHWTVIERRRHIAALARKLGPFEGTSFF